MIAFALTGLFFTCAYPVRAFSPFPHQTSANKDPFYGEVTVATVSTRWISNDPENVEWVVEVEGVPTEMYIIDEPAREEVSHIEIIHHPAITHKENVYSTRQKYVLRYNDDLTGLQQSITYYDLDEIQIQALTISYPNSTIDGPTAERYVSGTQTVVDQEAYDEEVVVIDQEASEEIGHYGIVNVGEIGHYENIIPLADGEGDGHYECLYRTKTVTYNGGK